MNDRISIRGAKSVLRAIGGSQVKRPNTIFAKSGGHASNETGVVVPRMPRVARLPRSHYDPVATAMHEHAHIGDKSLGSARSMAEKIEQERRANSKVLGQLATSSPSDVEYFRSWANKQMKEGYRNYEYARLGGPALPMSGKKQLLRGNPHLQSKNVNMSSGQKVIRLAANPLYREGIKPGTHRLGGVGVERKVRIRDIVSSQALVDEKKVRKLARFTKNMPGKATVSWNGKNWIAKDGNHRLNAMLKQGKRKATVLVQKLSSPSPLIQLMHNTDQPQPIGIRKRKLIKPRNPIQQLSAQLDSAIEFTTGRLLGGGILAGTAWEDTEEGKRFLKAATQQKDPRASDETGVKRTYRDLPEKLGGGKKLDKTEVVVKKGASLIRKSPEGKRQIFKNGEWQNEIKPSDLRDTEGMRTTMRARIATQHEPAVRKGWDEADFKRQGMTSAPPRVRAALARGIEGSQSEKQVRQVLAATKFIGHNQTRGPMEGTVQKIRGTTEGGASGILRDVQINRRLLQKYRRSLNEKAKKAGEAIPHPQAEPMSAEGMKEIRSAPKYKEGERPKKYSITQGKVRDMSGNPIHTPEPILRPGEENMLRSARGRLSSKGGLVEQETTRRKALSQRLYGRIKKRVESSLPKKIAAKTNVDDLLAPITRPHDPSEIQEINKRSVVTRDTGIEARNRQVRADRFARHAAEIGDVEIPQGFQPPPADKRSVQSPLVIKTVSEPGRVIKPYEELAGTLGIKGKSGRSAGERLGRIRERFNRLASPDAAETRKITNRLIDSGKAFTGGSIPIPKAKVNPSYPRLKIAGAGAALVGAGLLAHKLMRNKPEEEQRKRLAMSSRSPVIYFAKGKTVKKAAGKIVKKASGVIDTGGAVGPLQSVAAILKKQGVGPKIPLAKQLSMARSEAEAAINKANEVRQTSGELVGHAIRSSENGISAAKAAASERIASAEAAHAEALKEAAARRVRGMEGAAAGGLVAGTGLGGWLMARDKKKATELRSRSQQIHFSGDALTAIGQGLMSIGNTRIGSKLFRSFSKGLRHVERKLPIVAEPFKKAMEYSKTQIPGSGPVGALRGAPKGIRDQFRRKLNINQVEAKLLMRPTTRMSAKGNTLRFDSASDRRREVLEGAAKMGASAGISGGVGGLAIGLLSRPRSGSALGGSRKPAGALKNLGRASKLGLKAGLGLGAAGAGASLIGTALLGAPKEKDGAAFTKRGAVGGAITGGIGGAVLGGLSLRPGKAARLLERYGKTWLPVEAMRKSGPATRMAIGAGLGTVVGAAHLADEGQQVDTMRNLKKPVRMSSRIKPIHLKEEEEKMSTSSKLKRVAVGGLGGLMIAGSAKEAAGLKTVYHGTFKEAADNIRKEGIHPRYGGGDSGASAHPERHGQGHLSPEEVEIQRKQFMTDSRGKIHVTGSKGLASTFSGPKGEIIKATISQKDWDRMKPDFDGGAGFSKETSATSRKRIPIEQIHGSDAPLKSRIARTIKDARRGFLRGNSKNALGAIGIGSGLIAGSILLPKKKERQMSSRSPIVRFADMPLTGKLAADRYRKKIQDEDLDRRDANILRTAGAGAALGGLLGGKKGALIGAAAGAPIVPIIRSQTASGKDMYGDRSRQGKQAEGLPWKLAGLGAAGVLAHKGNQKLTAAKIGITKWGRRAKMGALGAAGLWAASKMFSAKQNLIQLARGERISDAMRIGTKYVSYIKEAGKKGIATPGDTLARGSRAASAVAAQARKDRAWERTVRAAHANGMRDGEMKASGKLLAAGAGAGVAAGAAGAYIVTRKKEQQMSTNGSNDLIKFEDEKKDSSLKRTLKAGAKGAIYGAIPGALIANSMVNEAHDRLGYKREGGGLGSKSWMYDSNDDPIHRGGEGWKSAAHEAPAEPFQTGPITPDEKIARKAKMVKEQHARRMKVTGRKIIGGGAAIGAALIGLLAMKASLANQEGERKRKAAREAKKLKMKMSARDELNRIIQFAYDEDDYDATERNLLRQGLQQQQDKDWRKIKSATNKAAQAGKRVKRLTQDIGRSWRGEKNVDSRGRERQREWDKPWFRNTLNTGIIGGAALGALAIKRGINPKGNLGKAIANVKQGVLTEKLSKVAPRTVGAYRKAKTFFTGAGDEAADALNKSEAVVSQTGPVAKFNKWVESGHGLRAVDDPQKALKALEAAKKKRLKTDPRHGKTIDAAIQGTLEHSSKLIPIHFDQRTEGDRLMLVRDIQRRQQRADAGKAKKENEKTKDVAIASGVGLTGLWTGKRWGRIAERKAQGLPVPAGLGTRIWRGIKAMSSQDPLIELNSLLDSALL